MPVKRYCGDCGRDLLPEEDGCPKCGTFHILEPMTIRIGEDGKFQAKTKFISRSKISKHGKEAKEHLRIDITGNRKIHHVVEKDSKDRWHTVHDETTPLKQKEETLHNQSRPN